MVSNVFWLAEGSWSNYLIQISFISVFLGKRKSSTNKWTARYSGFYRTGEKSFGTLITENYIYSIIVCKSNLKMPMWFDMVLYIIFYNFISGDFGSIGGWILCCDPTNRKCNNHHKHSCKKDLQRSASIPTRTNPSTLHARALNRGRTSRAARRSRRRSSRAATPPAAAHSACAFLGCLCQAFTTRSVCVCVTWDSKVCMCV